MREYVGIVRAILRDEDPPQGETFHSPFHFMGFEPRPDIPIYLAGLAPGMLRLAGEIADGVVLWLCNPEYIRRPSCRASPRAASAPASPRRASTSSRPSRPPSREPEQAKAQLRSELIPYFSLPFYRKMIELSGFGDDLDGFDSERAATRSPTVPRRLAAIGTAEEAEAVVRSYADSGATSPCIGGISKTDFDTTLEALAGCLG